MELIRTIYETYGWRFIAGCIFFGIIIAYLLYLLICDVLIKGCVEIDDKTTYRVGITNYTTEEGAKIRCQGLYKRHGVDAEVTIFSDNEKPIKLHASDIWDLNR